MDAGFAPFVNFLSHPPNANHPSDAAIHGAITHYTQALPLQNLPTFIRTVVTSPSLWTGREWTHLVGVQAAIRQSLHLKLLSIKKTTSSGWLFGPDLGSPLQSWIDAVCEGLQSPDNSLLRSHAVIAVLSGLGMGLEDVQRQVALPRLRYRLEKDLCQASANAVRFHRSIGRDVWAKDFTSSERAQCTLLMTCSFYPLSPVFADEQSLTSCLLARTLASIPSEHMYLIDVKVRAAVR